MVRRGGLLLALLALLAGAGVPRGWMPQASATGITLSLCSAGLDGAARQQALAAAHALLADALDKAGNHDSDQPAPDDPCPFAAAPTPPLPLAAEVPVIAPGPMAEAVLQPAAVTIGHGLAAPPPPATGPPLHHWPQPADPHALACASAPVPFSDGTHRPCCLPPAAPLCVRPSSSAQPRCP
ncbi:hypothetical protein [Croceibacterium ferulae]|uniref:hypothetical protein n=1 Tax=Croceibacterium ferulae TaxID=1854641 RepID=UPI001588007A|nr:hypothetical protein [Croceibacterium ferulae]